MAASPDKLAFSPIACRVLYVQRGPLAAGHRTRLHQHPYWQVEIAVAGTMWYADAQGYHALPRLRPLLLAPGVVHGFSYGAGVEFCSIKFTAEARGGEAIRLLDDAAGARALAACLVDLSTDDGQRARAALGGTLGGLLAWAQAPEPVEDLAAKIAGLVERTGCTSVQAVARGLGCSPGHAAARWRAEQGGSLKAAIDDLRGRRAEALLRYTSRPLAAIAEDIGCPDAAAASRFISRVCGRSPRAIRSGT